MISFNLIKVGLFSITVAPSRGPAPIGKPRKLMVPWKDDLQAKPDVLSLLSWRTYLSNFVGFKEQMEELRRWAMSTPQISLRFIVGEGGMGKTRTAAEFARTLQKQEKWAAGFIDLRTPQSYVLSKKGNLLVVDYPEEQRSGVKEILTDLANLEPEDRPCVRVLFLTRRPIEEWLDMVYDSKAAPIADVKPVLLHGLGGADAYEAFCSAQERAARLLKTTPVPVSEEQLAAWLRLTPVNERALFVVSAAVHSAIHPENVVLQYSGAEVVQAIARREISGLRSMTTDAGLKDPFVLARILSVAAVAGGIKADDIVGIANKGTHLLGLKPGEDLSNALRVISIGPEKMIPAPKPDILAAAMVVIALGESEDTAGELIWAGIERDVSSGLDRIARLSYDAEVVLGMHLHKISDWFAKSIAGRKDRCEILRPYFIETTLPIGWINAAVVMGRTLLDSVETEYERAEILNDLSVHLNNAGDNVGALEAIREAVELHSRLAEANPAQYEPDLAISLNNLSNFLSAAGDNAGALEAIREAVEIYRRLAEANTAWYEPNLATSMNNLSICLSAAGDNTEALDAIREAVKIRRRLAETNPARYEPNLAMSLNNLSDYLSAAGNNAGALEAIREAVEIRCRLAEANPAWYEPDLAMSLNYLSNCLSAAGDNTGALEAVREAVEIRRRLAEVNPVRYEPNLARNLADLEVIIRITGKH